MELSSKFSMPNHHHLSAKKNIKNKKNRHEDEPKQNKANMLFEMAAGQQIPANLHAALTYFIGELALLRIFLHRVLNYEDDLFSLLMVLVETHSLPTIETLRFRRRDVKIKANKDDRIQHLMRQTLVSVVFFGKLWHLHG